jgi:hypothetical protein
MKRIIKNEFNGGNNNIFKNSEITEIPVNSQKIHPVILNWVDNKNNSNPICLIKPSFDKEGLTVYKNYKCIGQNDNKFKSYLYTPPIGITAENLLKIYNVESIENLQNYISENINSTNIFTLNRIVNCWIRINFESIKLYNNFLEKIYKKFIGKYYDYDYFKILTDKINLDKEIKDFVDYWFDKNNSIGFKFDLLVEMINYLEKIKKDNLS